MHTLAHLRVVEIDFYAAALRFRSVVNSHLLDHRVSATVPDPVAQDQVLTRCGHGCQENQNQRPAPDDSKQATHGNGILQAPVKSCQTPGDSWEGTGRASLSV